MCTHKCRYIHIYVCMYAHIMRIFMYIYTYTLGNISI